MHISSNWKTLFERHWIALVALGLVVLVCVAFLPIFSMGFVTDDFIEVGARHFDAVDSLPAENWALWGSRFVERALIDPVTNWEIFRPTRQWVFWADYFMWHLEPFGYHVTNLLLYLATSFSVVLLAWHLTRRRSAAILAGLLFVVMPVHTPPVAEISSRGHVMAGLFVCLCVLFYALPRRRLYTVLAWVMAILAMGSKETALVLPALLLLYEIVYHRGDLRRAPRAFLVRQAPFWLIAAGVIALRLVLFGKLSSAPYGLGSWTLTYQSAGYALFALQPFIADINDRQTQVVLIVLVVVGVLYHARKEVVYGLLWIPVALVPTLAFPPAERYFYTASIGLALALGGILAQPFARPTTAGRVIGGGLAALLLISLGFSTYTRNLEHQNAGQIIQSVLQQIRTMHPTLPTRAQVYFVGLPEAIRHGYLFTAPLQVQYALQLAYNDRSLHVMQVDDFPTTFQRLDRTFFFEYDRRQIVERNDLTRALRERPSCANAPDKKVEWTFEQDTRGWEPWNEIDEFQARDGALQMHIIGNDPFMGGPIIEVQPGELKRIEIQLRAQAAQPTFQAELYWQTAAMADFSGEARAVFSVDADDKSHIFTLEPKIRGDSPVIRLRLDPSDMPAQIQLERITIYCK